MLENDKRTLSVGSGLFFQKTDFRSNGSIKNISGIQLGASGFAGFVGGSILLKMGMIN